MGTLLHLVDPVDPVRDIALGKSSAVSSDGVGDPAAGLDAAVLPGPISRARDHTAAGPPTNSCYRTTTENLLPLVAGLCQKLDDL